MTKLLAMLVCLSALACALAVARMRSLCDAASAARDDLREVRAGIDEIAASPTVAADAGGNDDVGRRIRDAAEKAQATETLSSVEPARSGESNITAVLLRFDPLTLRQLVTFIHTLTNGGADGSIRADAIALSAGADPQRWSATVTLSVRGGGVGAARAGLSRDVGR